MHKSKTKRLCSGLEKDFEAAVNLKSIFQVGQNLYGTILKKWHFRKSGTKFLVFQYQASTLFEIMSIVVLPFRDGKLCVHKGAGPPVFYILFL